ncbi:hypothetical protein BCE75_11282 [Isoptericola sp. CG 20/1183]|uniref:Uncharacterized protein n=1 Tax=Isoptericola halotolerans TaxID=300560 RepID=A0ABX5EAG1_9MICO|nr:MULTISPECIES: hypothetical protein [Isoptericola]PRZ03863.1 hypothetical protein BCE75_11282 [Isoptericola sp. CG 20/1183]PRZ04004.1 hypothetical protein BCL65_11138 [Isoptericola halotolerans]
MQIIAFHNELAMNDDRDPTDADVAVGEVCRAVREVSKRRPGLVVVAPSILEHDVARNYKFRDWLRKPKNRDLGRWLLTRANRAPISRPVSSDESGVEYVCRGKVAAGLGAAHIYDGIAFSLDDRGEWASSAVPIHRSRLVERDVGEIDVVEDRVTVRNLSRVTHLSPHLDWIAKFGLSDVTTGHQVWNSRDEFYPYLRFLPGVEGQLISLERSWVEPVAKQLYLINRAAIEWDPEERPAPLWLSKVTPEHEVRRRSGIFDFLDVDQRVHTFDLHSRFTPGPGRVYFRLAADERKIVVAHVGRKLI